MSVKVEYRVSGPHIHITEAVAAVPEMEVSIERWRIQPENRLSGFIVASGDRFDEFEAALDAVENVCSIETINATGSARLYQLELVSKTQHLPEYSTIEGFMTNARLEPDGVYATGNLKDHDEVDKLCEFAANHEIEIDIVQVYEVEEDTSDRLLTDEQRNALVTAYEMGYFDVPSGATQEEVAARLDIAATSLSERLTRAQNRLVEGYLIEDPSMDAQT